MKKFKTADPYQNHQNGFFPEQVFNFKQLRIEQRTNIYCFRLVGTKNCKDVMCYVGWNRMLSSNLTILLWILISDSEHPVFTFYPSDIFIDNATEVEMRIYWQQPTASDNSGVPPSLSSNRKPG